MDNVKVSFIDFFHAGSRKLVVVLQCDASKWVQFLTALIGHLGITQWTKYTKANMFGLYL